MKTVLKVKTRSLLADLQTPVGIYLKVRDMFPTSALLESSDYHSSENSVSYIGVEPMARFTVQDGVAGMQLPDGSTASRSIGAPGADDSLAEILNEYLGSFQVEGDRSPANGLFGYTSYDAVRYFENVDISRPDAADPQAAIPEAIFILYRFVIAINHFRNELTITENSLPGEPSRAAELISAIHNRDFASYDFQTRGEATSNTTDARFKKMVARGIECCKSGELAQIVLSRRWEQPFTGDDFKVYRALRSINPSPYLFYFDFGSFRIFGSSPETHLKIEGDTVTIDPIAGTFRRTGDDVRDRQLAERLLEDPKENAEHEMLVELARADLSRNSSEVRIKRYKQVQFYSHVIHMVSRVCGRIAPETNRIRVFADTFPAGTVSGAPKTRSLQLIDEIEGRPRGVYGGCIGHIGFDGNLNQAITIRSFVSTDGVLYSQAGAGVVAQSTPQKELEEVNNKLSALAQAVEIAGELKN
jgi:anthranilate synthase component 1